MLYRKRNCQYKYQSRKYMLDQIDKFQRDSFIFYLPQYHRLLRLVSVFALYTHHHHHHQYNFGEGIRAV